MKLLIDSALSPLVAERLQAQGHDVHLVKVTVRPKARQTEPCPPPVECQPERSLLELAAAAGGACPECGCAYMACWRCGYISKEVGV